MCPLLLGCSHGDGDGDARGTVGLAVACLFVWFVGQGPISAGSERPDVAHCVDVFGSGSGSGSVTRCQWQQRHLPAANSTNSTNGQRYDGPCTLHWHSRAHSSPTEWFRGRPSKSSTASTTLKVPSSKDGRFRQRFHFSPLFFSGFLLVEHALLAPGEAITAVSEMAPSAGAFVHACILLTFSPHHNACLALMPKA